VAIRRQFKEFVISDNGSETTEDLEAFIDKPQSIFTSGYGNANLTQSQKLMDNQFITIEGLGSTPGLNATDAVWCPRGYVNIKIETTTYYTNPDNRPNTGVSGTGSPYPLSVQWQRSYNSFPKVYIYGGTTFDVTYYCAESFTGLPDAFAGDSFTMVMAG
jgi:hypothetical protein